MREPQHKPLIKIGKTQKVAELCQSGQGWPIQNDLYPSWVHMYTFLINDVSILGQAKSAFLQVST